MYSDNPGAIHWRTIFSLRSIGFTVLGVFLAVVGLQGFLLPNHFLDGGITGISILIKGFADLHISIYLVVFNLPFLIMGYYRVSKTFAVQSLIAVILLALGMYFISIPVFTQDKVLIAIFGGFCIGLGIGLVIRGGGVIDGIDVVAQYTERKSAFTAGEIILVLNTLMVLGAAYKFGIEAGMYSILVYFTAMKTTTYVVDGFEEFTCLNIISGKSEDIKTLMVHDFKKSIAIYKGERGYLPGKQYHPRDADIIVLIVTRLEVHRITKAINRIDPDAFLFINSIKEVRGGVVRRR